MREQNYTHDHYYGYSGDKPEVIPQWLVWLIVGYVFIETTCWAYAKVVF